MTRPKQPLSKLQTAKNFYMSDANLQKLQNKKPVQENSPKPPETGGKAQKTPVEGGSAQGINPKGKQLKKKILRRMTQFLSSNYEYELNSAVRTAAKIE